MSEKTTDQKIEEIVEAATRHGADSIIALAGVPGTGKSHLGAIAAQEIAGEPLRVRELQFHQSFSYEEFVEGMRIDASGAVTVAPGAFLEWNDAALADEEHRYVILVEELTRANVAAVLGELLTYVEHRDRMFMLTYSRRPVRVAKNLIIMATYNPTDRSAIDVDSALLRRLRILPFPPSKTQLREMLSATEMRPELISEVEKIFSECEAKHRDDYEQLMPFGHGAFAGIKDEDGLRELWGQRIRHFLYRPLMEPHPFAETIQENYPWR